MTTVTFPRSLAGCVLAIGLLQGCVGYTLVKGGERTELSSSISVVPSRDWNRRSQDHVDYWTLDGAALQHIIFVKGIGDGDVLWHTSADKEKAPHFRKGMNAIEISELAQATMALEKLQKVNVAKLRPSTFAGHSGFTFDFTATTESGLDILGTANGAVVGERLYLAVYRGAALFYFDRSRDDYEKILASFRIGGET